jgi:prevent-host-death family protein
MGAGAMATVTVHTAKTELSKLIARVERGERIVIARGKRPVVELVAYRSGAPRRKFGALKGKIKLDESFWEPLPPEELKRWGIE